MVQVFREPGVGLAYEFAAGAGPVLVFCSGYGSDMGGTKAMRLWEFCGTRGQAMLRFDYAGHGASGGRFEDGCIGDWAADAAFIMSAVVPGREVVLVGSSMGGWIALLLARALGALVRGMVLIAPAPDFTEDLTLRRLSTPQLEALRRDGVIYPPSEYGAPMPLTLKLLEDGARHLLLNGVIPITCPIRILHGMRDPDVPWEQSLKLAASLASEDVRLIFVKDGDHRLSREQDLVLLEAIVGES
jgi:pimeloyl-ACP methyl ester carboxylesterase